MDSNTTGQDYQEVSTKTESRFPEFTEERARELADEICGMMGYHPDSCELFIELLRGIIGECKTTDHDGDHACALWAIREAFIYTRSYDKNFNAWLKGEGGNEDETIN